MKIRAANVIFGFTALFLTAVVGGSLLGGTFDAHSIKDGYHALPLARFYLREGHSHGNFMSFYNLFVGLLVENLVISPKLRTVCSYAAMVAIFLPVGLALKGAAGAPSDYPPIGMIGILGAAISLGILVVGSWRTRTTH